MQPTYQTQTNEYGMAAFVYVATRGGFNVTLRDMDAEMTFPQATNYPTIERAIEAADALVA